MCKVLDLNRGGNNNNIPRCCSKYSVKISSLGMINRAHQIIIKWQLMVLGIFDLRCSFSNNIMIVLNGTSKGTQPLNPSHLNLASLDFRYLGLDRSLGNDL